MHLYAPTVRHTHTHTHTHMYPEKQKHKGHRSARLVIINSSVVQVEKNRTPA